MIHNAGTKQLKLDPSIYESIQKEKVQAGDVIYIESNSGAVKRVGRCDAYATEYDLEVSHRVPLCLRSFLFVFAGGMPCRLCRPALCRRRDLRRTPATRG